MSNTDDITYVRSDPMSEYCYTVYFESVKGGYNVVVPAIPEICTFGETLEEAREMAKDAIRCVIESARKAGESIPVDLERKEQLTVAI